MSDPYAPGFNYTPDQSFLGFDIGAPAQHDNTWMKIPGQIGGGLLGSFYGGPIGGIAGSKAGGDIGSMFGDAVGGNWGGVGQDFLSSVQGGLQQGLQGMNPMGMMQSMQQMPMNLLGSLFSGKGFG